LQKINSSMDDNVLTVRLEGIGQYWEQDILLVSDQHHDSIFANKILEKKHLDEAKEKDALIFMAGDTFDAMQGRNDPRSSYDALDPQLKVNNYFDALVEFNAAFYAPYAQNIVLIGKGNHESSVEKHHNIDLTSNLVHKLNTDTGSNIKIGGYGGWVKFLFTIGATHRFSLNMKYFHGSGGDAPVTRGVLQTARQAVFLPDADIVWNGHNHNEYTIPIQRERLTERGKRYQDSQWHVRTPGYLDAYGDGSGGWEVESGKPPKPKGCVWLKMFTENGKIIVKATSDIR